MTAKDRSIAIPNLLLRNGRRGFAIQRHVVGERRPADETAQAFRHPGACALLQLHGRSTEYGLSSAKVSTPSTLQNARTSWPQLAMNQKDRVLLRYHPSEFSKSSVSNSSTKTLTGLIASQNSNLGKVASIGRLKRGGGSILSIPPIAPWTRRGGDRARDEGPCRRERPSRPSQSTLGVSLKIDDR